ncbi:MAG: hypothetical protein KKA05_02025, partial [Alphaproteobacteria bacterium]|nr:hypothetical protein [Alphaproteobacteria bacterium]
CISDVLDQLEKITTEGRARFQIIIPVSSDMPDCGGFPDDAFTLSSTPKLLDINNEQSIHDLGMLLDDAPLYNINMQLVLDDALSERHKNAMLDKALEKAFAPDPLPNTLTSGDKLQDDPAGSLRHPMLEHIDSVTLCRLYTGLLRNLPVGQKEYGFERNILGKHGERFMEMFDGFIGNGEGKIKAEILVGFGSRRDHDLSRPMESYIEMGTKIARRMAMNEPHELLWAWLEADNYQMRRCRDIDRLLRLGGLPRIPNWVRTDIFSFLEKESMKQFFAQQMKSIDQNLSFMGDALVLKKAVEANAQGQVDDLLQQLLQQTLNTNTPYSGAAGAFVTAAQLREREAHKTKLG